MPTPQPSSDDARWIAIRISRLGVALTTLLAITALVMLLVVGFADNTWLPRPLTWALLAACVCGIAFELARTLRPPPTAIVALYLLELDADDPTHSPVLGIRVRCADASEVQGTVMANAFVTPWFASIPYRERTDPRWRAWWPRVVPLWRDALDADAFREIRVRLRWH